MYRLGAVLLAASTVASAMELAPVSHYRREAHNDVYARSAQHYKRDDSNDMLLHPVQYPEGAFTVKRQANNPFTPDHELDMEYADMESYNDAKKDTFGATVRITTKDPAVQTEQFGNEVTGIQCTDSSMEFSFLNADVAKQAESVWNIPALTIITRTEGCNDNDERVPWSLSNFRFDDNKATADAKKLDWDAASDGMTVDFGSRGNVTNPDALRNNYTNPSTRKRDDTIAKQDLTFNLKDQVLFTQSKAGLTQSCKDCHGKGTATLKTGKFSVKGVASAAAAVKTDAEKAGNAVKTEASKAVAAVETKAAAVETKAADLGSKIKHFFGGRSPLSDIASHFAEATVDLSLDGFSGSFLFESKLDSKQEFTFHLAGKQGWGLPGLSIKDIVTVGPSIDPTLVISADLSEPLVFDYGFEFTMPDGAGMSLNFIDPGKSTVNKIQQTTFKALPFTNNVADVVKKGFKMSASFRPVISLGVKFLKETIDPLEVALEIPKFNAVADFADNVDKDCKAGGNMNALNFKGDFAFGVGADSNIKAFDAVDFNPSAKIFSTSGVFPVSTCLALREPTKPSAVATPTATPADGQAARVRRNAPENTGSSYGAQESKGHQNDRVHHEHHVSHVSHASHENDRSQKTCTDGHESTHAPGNGGDYGHRVSSAPAPPKSASSGAAPAPSQPVPSQPNGGNYGQGPAPQASSTPAPAAPPANSAPAQSSKPASSSAPAAPSQPAATQSNGGNYGQGPAPSASSAPAQPSKPASSSVAPTPSQPAATQANGGNYGQGPATPASSAPASSNAAPAPSQPTQTQSPGVFRSGGYGKRQEDDEEWDDEVTGNDVSRRSPKSRKHPRQF